MKIIVKSISQPKPIMAYLHLGSKERNCYIMGDYNLDLLKHEIHHPTENFLDIMYTNYLVPLINRPTRITRQSSTLIDILKQL